MDWKRLLNTEIVAFPPDWMSKRARIPVAYRTASLIQRLRTLRGAIFVDLLHVTFCLCQAVACNAPLVPALDAMMDDAPTSRTLRVLARLRAALNAGLSLSEAIRRQPLFFPRFYADLVAAGERSGTLLASLREVSEMLRRCQQLALATWGIWAHLAQTTVATILMVSFMQVKIIPVFRGMFADFSEQLHQPVSFPDWIFAWFGQVFAFAGRIVDLVHFTEWPGLARVLFIMVLLPTVAITALRARRSRPMMALLRGIPGIGRVFNKARWAVLCDALGRLLHAGYPLDEALDSMMEGARGRHRRQLMRLRDSVRRGTSFHETLAAEGRRLPHVLRDLVFVGETSGRLPETLAEIAHMFQEQSLRSAMVLTRVGFCLTIVALGGLVFQVYAGGFMVYIAVINLLLDSL